MYHGHIKVRDCCIFKDLLILQERRHFYEKEKSGEKAQTGEEDEKNEESEKAQIVSTKKEITSLKNSPDFGGVFLEKHSLFRYSSIFVFLKHLHDPKNTVVARHNRHAPLAYPPNRFGDRSAGDRRDRWEIRME